MPSNIHLTKTLIAGNAALIAASQTPGAAGLLTLTTAAGVTLDTQRRVIITSAGNNSGVTFTITGANNDGLMRTETVAGANAGVSASLYDYRTVTAVSISGASTGAITVGTSTTGSTDWKFPDTRNPVFNLNVVCTVTGTITYSIEATNSAVMQIGTPSTINIQPTSVTAATASAIWTQTAGIHAWRVTVTAGTGSVAIDAVQVGEI